MTILKRNFGMVKIYQTKEHINSGQKTDWREREVIMKTFLKAVAGVSIIGLGIYGLKTLWDNYQDNRY